MKKGTFDDYCIHALTSRLLAVILVVLLLLALLAILVLVQAHVGALPSLVQSTEAILQ